MSDTSQQNNRSASGQTFCYSHLIRSIARYALAKGVTAVDLFSGTEIDEAVVEDPYVRLRPSQQIAFFRNLLRTLDTPGIGFQLGKIIPLHDLGTFGYATQCSETGSDALNTARQFFGLYLPFAHWDVQISGGYVQYALLDAEFPEDLRQYFEELTATLICSHSIEILGEIGRPESVHFTYSLPSYAQEMAIYFDCELKFDMPTFRSITSDHILHSRVKSYDPYVAATLLTLCKDMQVAIADEKTFLMDVKLVINSKQMGFPSQSDLAKALCVSSRTLNRRLSQYNTTFNDLLLEARNARARELLKNRDIPVSQVAYRCGYKHVQSFSSSFKHSTGLSPVDFRREHQSS